MMQLPQRWTKDRLISWFGAMDSLWTSLIMWRYAGQVGLFHLLSKVGLMAFGYWELTL
jgi:hypothetical protein